jgi:hypothetical protein
MSISDMDDGQVDPLVGSEIVVTSELSVEELGLIRERLVTRLADAKISVSDLESVLSQLLETGSVLVVKPGIVSPEVAGLIASNQASTGAKEDIPTTSGESYRVTLRNGVVQIRNADIGSSKGSDCYF